MSVREDAKESRHQQDIEDEKRRRSRIKAFFSAAGKYGLLAVAAIGVCLRMKGKSGQSQNESS